MTPEGQVKATCRRWSRARGLLFFSIEGKSYNGVPDTVCGLAYGGIAFVEFKRPGSQGPTDQQWRRINELRAAGARATWCDNPQDFSEIMVSRDSLLLWRNEQGGIDL